MNTKEKLSRLFSVSALLALLPFFSGLGIYLGNLPEYTFTLPQYAIVMGAFCAGLFVCWSVLQLCFFRTKIFRYVLCLCFAFGICVWLQGNFLMWPLDRSKSILGFLDHPFFGMIEILICLSVIFLLFRFRIQVEKKMSLVVCLIIVSQILIAIPAIGKYDSSMLGKFMKLDVSEMFHFSKQGNCILIVVDSLSDAQVQKICEGDDNKIKQGLKDFERFPHLLSKYPQTFFALPTLLSGSPVFDDYLKWDVSKDVWEQTTDMSFLAKRFSHFHELYDEAYKSPNSIFHVMSENDYHTEMYPLAGVTVYVPSDSSVISNYNVELAEVKKKQFFSTQLLEEDIIPYALYRNATLLLKSAVYKLTDHILWFAYSIYCGDFEFPSFNKTSDTEECLYSPLDTSFFQIPTEKTTIQTGDTDIQKRFKVIHLEGVHGDDSKVNEDTPNYLIRSGVYYFGEGILPLLDYMKQNGYYDNSWIFIIGDHGNHFAPVSEQFNPALLIKRPGANQEKMTKNEEYVFMRDIAPSLLTEMGIQKGEPFSIWNLTEVQKAERKADWKRFVEDNRP